MVTQIALGVLLGAVLIVIAVNVWNLALAIVEWVVGSTQDNPDGWLAVLIVLAVLGLWLLAGSR